MKIVFFSLNRLAFTGGAEKYILQVSRVLKDKGHRVYYLGDCRPLLAFNVLAAFLLGVINFKNFLVGLKDLLQAPSFPNEAASFIFPRRLALGVLLPFSNSRREARALLEGCDLVFVKNEILDMFVFFLLTLNWHKVKAALLVFSSFTYPSRSPRGRLHNLFYLSSLYSFLVHHYQTVIVSNRADTTFLVKKFKIEERKVRYVPYGLNPEDFPAVSSWARNDNRFNILFVGRLEEQKGIDILVEVIRRLVTGATPPRENPSGLIPSTRRVEESAGRTQEKIGEMRFTIVGDGPWRDPVVRLAEELPQVEYLGELPRAQVIQEYRQHDLLVVPSRWETFSYVTLEAQFCGLPVVAFNIPGPQDIIEEGITGKLVATDDVEGFKEAVFDYFKKDISTEEKKYIQERAQREFSLEKTAERLAQTT